MDIREVPIADIIVRRDRAKPKEEEVILLAGSIEEIGLQQPITINVVQDREAGGEEPDGLLLVFGGHRLEACKRLGWTTIPANILTVNEIDAELIEIDENLRRRVLDQLETGALLKRRQELYESRHPETRRGVIGGKSGGRGREKIASANVALAIPAQTASFTQDVAQKTGRSVRSVQCDIAIAKAIPDDVRDVLVDTPIANNKSELKKLGKLDPKHKKAAAKAIASGKAKTVAEAVSSLDLPACETCGGTDYDERGECVACYARIKPAAADVVKDAKGKAVPARLRECFGEKKPVFDQIRRQLGGSLKTLESLAKDPIAGVWLGLLNVRSDLRNAMHHVKFGTPYAVCPYCKGRGCDACKKAGWLNQSAFQAAPEEQP